MKRAAIGILFAFSVIGLRAQTKTEEPAKFLRAHMKFSQDELSSLERGHAVAKLLDTANPAEVPPFGIVRVKASKDFFLEKYRDIATFKKSAEVLQIAKFQYPPRIEDLETLSLDPSEIETLRRCKVGDCAVKLSAPMIERLQKEISWGSQDHAKQVLALYRRMLFEYVKIYLSEGNAALVTYRDKAGTVWLADEADSLLQASTYLSEYLPDLRKSLREFPGSPLANSEQFIYWSKEKFGYKPVVSITHVTIYQLPPETGRAAVIAARQIYASHYFLGSLGLCAFAEIESAPSGPNAYLMYLNRSRIDLPQGLFGGIIRYFMKRRVRDGMEKYLKLIKDRLEAQYSARPTP